MTPELREARKARNLPAYAPFVPSYTRPRKEEYEPTFWEKKPAPPTRKAICSVCGKGFMSRLAQAARCRVCLTGKLDEDAVREIVRLRSQNPPASLSALARQFHVSTDRIRVAEQRAAMPPRTCETEGCGNDMSHRRRGARFCEACLTNAEAMRRYRAKQARRAA